MAEPHRPIVIVTGANGGVGYGICQRLLLQLCSSIPSDSRRQAFAPDVTAGEPPKRARYPGVTLIMACRNMKRAETARRNLLQWFDSEMPKLLLAGEPDGDEERLRAFREACDVQIAELDLASFASVIRFSKGIKEKVPYVSHVIFNAGVASFKAIDWWPCAKQFLTDPMGAVTAPTYYIQHAGEISPDNLGWVWQSNVFGHFTLFRELESLLEKSPFDASRVIWCSSLEASPKHYDAEDWQLVRTSHSYESSKYQIDLIATRLDQLARVSAHPKPIRHFVTEPGVCSTMISNALTGPVLDMIKVLSFYLARWFGSPHHTILPLKAAVAAIHLMLVPLLFVLNDDPKKPVRYGAQTGRWGNERVGTTPVKDWITHQSEGATLIQKCDALYSEMKMNLGQED